MPFITGNQAKQQAERRGAERRRVSLGSWVTSLDGSMVVACQTSDASARGVRVHLKEDRSLPQAIYYLDVKDRIAYEALVRWQDKTGAGLEFTKAYRFVEVASPEMKKVIASICG